MTELVPLWVEIIVSVFLAISGVFALAGGLGLLRLDRFMLRMHAPALGVTLGSWSVAFALIVYFSALEQALSTHAWLIIIFLAITTPITTVLLARAALFLGRQQGQDGLPPALSNTRNADRP
jgi:multicomponent K+:H+ antiporter subunit G